TCVACIMEGSRPILAEVQVLATKSGFASPRRVCTGFDYNRMAMIVAVLEKRAGLFFGTMDIYVNVVGGFKLDEPAGDLSVALALQSSLFDKPVSEKVIAFGEIGLGGEIRSISHVPNRIREAERMGFDVVILPKHSMKEINPGTYKTRIIGVSNIRQAFAAVNAIAREETDRKEEN
ncbi:MAG: DNA repair protein RadA, partial [Oscillospiraceae bacterium]|nr:DNA repair protein RadA [Oscillospiraceae bacterium]